MKSEYVRNLHSNYERICLDEKPEEKRYQYCILSRGGIKGLLPCSLRYLDGEAYLYYDITSKQNIVQFYQKGNIGREWLLDFFDSVHHLQQELGRFLLQENNILWDPDHIFQDLESNIFSFLYMPYYEGENHFLKLLGFFVEKVNYEDEVLVECIYKLYEQFEKNGDIYLQEQIFKDVKALETAGKKKQNKQGRVLNEVKTVEKTEEIYEHHTLYEDGANLVRAVEEQAERHQLEKGTAGEYAAKQRDIIEENRERQKEKMERDAGKSTIDDWEQTEKADFEKSEAAPRKLFGFFEGKRNRKGREQELREQYRESAQQLMTGYVVAEETEYEEEYGRTAFITERPEKKDVKRRLYHSDGRKASDLEVANLLIGKYKGKVDIYIEDESVSRMHARILKDQGEYYLEDSNSTNGTYLNKQRLQPYERKKLEQGDEIRCGNVAFFFR